MTASAISSSASTQPATTTKTHDNIALGYLRAFVIVLVVAHHAMLAYHPFAPPPHRSLVTLPHWWGAFPVVDTQHSNLFALLIGFNDVFFMSLMFFLSGLFVWHSIERKGAGLFLRDRFRRLAIPFVIAAGLLAPLAYYPSFLQTGSHGGLTEFCHQWLSLGEWPAGPAWFLWVLLVFDCVAAALFVLAPKTLGAAARAVAKISKRTVVFFASLTALSAVAYVPLSLAVSPLQWSSFGPFFFQTARSLHYLAYFLVAVALGATPAVQGLFTRESKLRRRWPLWITAALFAFTLEAAVTIAALTSHPGSASWTALASFTFTLSCAASCFAFLALFLRFANARNPAFDSLRENSYGIYLLHYFCVSWLQYALLSAHLPALAKGSVVFLGALAISWSLSAALRRIPAAARLV